MKVEKNVDQTKTIDPDDPFHDAVEKDRTPNSVNEFSRKITPKGESQKEDRQNDADRSRRRTHAQGQDPNPDRLVNEARHSREDKK